VSRCLPTAAATCRRRTKQEYTRQPGRTAPDREEVIIANLNVVCCHTESQWSWCSTGLLWSNFLVLVTTCAAAFWTVWSFVSRLSLIPYSRLSGQRCLQLFSTRFASIYRFCIASLWEDPECRPEWSWLVSALMSLLRCFVIGDWMTAETSNDNLRNSLIDLLKTTVLR